MGSIKLPGESPVTRPPAVPQLTRPVTPLASNARAAPSARLAPMPAMLRIPPSGRRISSPGTQGAFVSVFASLTMATTIPGPFTGNPPSSQVCSLKVRKTWISRKTIIR